MKILYLCQHYNYLSGSPMYVYEVAKEMVKRGHDVTVAAWQVGEPFLSKSQEAGIKVRGLEDLGWGYDIVCAQQPGPTAIALAKFPDTPIIQTVHSEWHFESPVIDPRVSLYIAIRPTIREKLVSDLNVAPERVRVVYNGIDTTRFNTSMTDLGGYILFCGTIDNLRKQAFADTLLYAEGLNKNVLLIGKPFEKWHRKLPKHAQWLPDMWTVEKYVKLCDMTAGILLGRTTIEGWFCGKPGIIYDIDLDGRIKGKAIHKPPEDLYEKHDIRNVCAELESIYVSLV